MPLCIPEAESPVVKHLFISGPSERVAKTFISEIKPNQEVAAAFLIADKQLRTARNGNAFLTLKLVDKTGQIVARIWEGADEAATTLAANSVVFVHGRSEQFRNELQLQIQEITPLPSEQIDPADFLPVCPLSTDLLFDRLKKILSTVKRRPLQQLLQHLLGDRQLMKRFRRAPAAKSMHHAYLGGLLEHTVSVVELVARLAEHYPDLDRDLLLTGAVWHDLGKIHEFTYELHIDYSDSGRLLGHMVLGLEILEGKIRSVKDFPDDQALLLKHLILSHHGETEYGAVKLPMTREALALHFADDLDAKMHAVSRILAEAPGETGWTAYQPLFSRYFCHSLPTSGETTSPPEVRRDEPRGVQLSIWTPEENKNDW